MKNKTLFSIVFLVFIGITAYSQDENQHIPNNGQLPLKIEDVKPLRELVNSPLEDKLILELNKNIKW